MCSCDVHIFKETCHGRNYYMSSLHDPEEVFIFSPIATPTLIHFRLLVHACYTHVGGFKLFVSTKRRSSKLSASKVQRMY